MYHTIHELAGYETFLNFLTLIVISIILFYLLNFVGEQGSKVVNGGSKSNSDEGNYMKMTCLTNKEFGMMLLMTMPRVST